MNAAEQVNYFDPVTLNRIDRLDLRARLIVEGYISGQHRSPYHGISVEFAEYREYVPGDDIKHIDWKVWAKADRLLLKQYEEETNMQVHLLFDCSKSMAYRGLDKNRLCKFDYASTLTACLSYLLGRQQDAVGMTLFDNDIRLNLPPSSNPRQARQLVHELQNCEPDHRSDVDSVFALLPSQIKRRGLVILISDLFMDLEHFKNLLKQLGHARHEVLVIHMLDEDEVTFPFDGNTQFHGLEVDEQILVDAPALRKNYLKAMDDFQRDVRHICGRSNAKMLSVHTGMPLDAVLSQYLHQRKAI